MKYLNNLYSHLDRLKLDLGSGIFPKEGFIGIDNFTGIKSQSVNPNSINLFELSVIRHDLKEGIPFESDLVDEIRVSHFLEHCAFLPELLEEIHRCLKEGGLVDIIVPYGTSVEGLYPGHELFFTEKWFLENLHFNKLFSIQKIIFYESEYYTKYKDKLSKFFSFEEARYFLFNCCYQLQILCKVNKKIDNLEKISEKITYEVIPWQFTTTDRKISYSYRLREALTWLFRIGLEKKKK